MGLSVTILIILFLAASFKLAGFSDELIGDFQGNVQVPLLQPLRWVLMSTESQRQLQNVFDLPAIQRVGSQGRQINARCG